MDQSYEVNTDPHTFTDADGVLFDFERGFELRFGGKFHETPVGVAWNLIYKTPDFYAELPLMPNAFDYWDTIRPHHPTVLTGAPTAGRAAAEAAKRFAIKKHFGAHVPVIVCARVDKPKHMKNPGDLLIDDHQKNIDPWVEAGGQGILFKDAASSIEEIRFIIAMRKGGL